jgi:outer membrane lipoprotein-sorting protein
MIGSVTISIAALLVLSGSVRSAAQNPSAETIVKQMVQKYRSLNSFEEIATETREQTMGAMQQKLTLKAKFVYKKPNKFLYQVDDPMRGVTSVCDGKNFYFLPRQLNQYRKHPAPANLSEILRLEPLAGTTMDAMAFLRGEDPLKGTKNSKVVGSEALSGRPTYRVRFERPIQPRRPTAPNAPTISGTETFEMWIGKEDSLLYKMQMTAKMSVGQQSITTVATETHTQMKVNQSVADSAFAFKPPQGAKEVKEFQAPGMPGQQPAPPKK